MFLILLMVLMSTNLFAKKFKSIDKAISYLDEWTMEEKEFYVDQSTSSIKIRSYLLEHFYNKQEASQKERFFFIPLIKFELKEAMKKKHHSEVETKNILVALQLIDSYKLKSFFYQVIPFVAFPLQEVRHASYALLQDMGDDRVFPFLMILANSPKAMNRIYAIKAFQNLSDRRLTSFLIKHLSDKNKSVRYATIEALEYLQEKKAIQNLKNVIVRDKYIEVRVRAMEALTNLETKNSAGFFSTLLHDNQARIRYAAAEALRKLKATKTLSSRLGQERNCNVQKKILQALIEGNKIKNNENDVINLLKHSACHEDTLIWQIYAFQRIGDRHLATVVVPYLKHSSAKVKEEAAWALTQTWSKDLPNQEMLIKILKKNILNNKEPLSVRMASLHALLPHLQKEQKEHLKRNLRKKIFYRVLLYSVY